MPLPALLANPLVQQVGIAAGGTLLNSIFGRGAKKKANRRQKDINRLLQQGPNINTDFVSPELQTADLVSNVENEFNRARGNLESTFGRNLRDLEGAYAASGRSFNPSQLYQQNTNALLDLLGREATGVANAQNQQNLLSTDIFNQQAQLQAQAQNRGIDVGNQAAFNQFQGQLGNLQNRLNQQLQKGQNITQGVSNFTGGLSNYLQFQDYLNSVPNTATSDNPILSLEQRLRALQFL